MRFLHTSDWHLGVTIQGASCEEEQRRFLSWLLDTLEEQAIDALIVAGDIFHRDQPPARALNLYYDFLANCRSLSPLKKVIVVGGNHDSPTRLDAPQDILGALDVHVVGGLRADESTWANCLCPIAAGDGDEVEAVVAAVPYVQEAKLGIVTTSADASEIRRQYGERFGHLYQTLAQTAADRYPDLPLIATGHLTCHGQSEAVDEGDVPDDIHQVGTISGLPPSIFGNAYDYVALGHIHRMFPVDSGRIWYCGTPVATSRNETSPRFVLIGDTDHRDDKGQLIIDKVRIPIWRPVFGLRGTVDEIDERLDDLPKTPDLVPYLFVDIEAQSVNDYYEAQARLQKVVDERFQEGYRPRFVDFRTHLPPQAVPDANEADDELASLDSMTPEEVFIELYKRQVEGHEPSSEVLQAFRYLNQTRDSRDDEPLDAPVFQPAPPAAQPEAELEAEPAQGSAEPTANEDLATTGESL